jgi:linoleoyl-CoA desaturase
MKIKGQVKFVDNDKSKFFMTLKKRVDNYFTENNISKHANGAMVIKTIVLLAVYIIPFLVIVNYSTIIPGNEFTMVIDGIWFGRNWNEHYA